MFSNRLSWQTHLRAAGLADTEGPARQGNSAWKPSLYALQPTDSGVLRLIVGVLGLRDCLMAVACSRAARCVMPGCSNSQLDTLSSQTFQHQAHSHQKKKSLVEPCKVAVEAGLVGYGCNRLQI